ncbi:MAG TPA: septum formation initiator family protein [Rectinema sp.]|jgi:cell division protein FtsB|nr:septum formation initiator family protein [Spirochaetia bacterium]MDI9426717.1 septum formation initiator family protein [Spirochaetota bacterium]NLH89679.1 hypothetical protein [Treponema sp.]HNP92532.1 septum formation initiator family protein [Rectinema sp.]HNT58731.1 septum formation initiator family protein [Rectinema sp.]
MPKIWLMYSPHSSFKTSKRLLGSLSYGLFSFLIAYCFISVVAGKAGILAYKDLALQKQRIQIAIYSLQTQNENKMNTIEELKSNPYAAAEMAAALGYIHQGEVLITLPESWRDAGQIKNNEVNTPILAGESTGLPDPLIRVMSAITGILVFLAIQLFQYKSIEQSAKRISLENRTEPIRTQI